ncbi:Protein CBG17492 [Caenorhabditis briggsae]|uniref:Protein CBG17492 n=1 Tax=Caenorhabditis briggsae TaxID=6238 RepID=A8XR25_CAEBR|nr:Protein CBG17492 [Caenorhabditis briggsae]CAP35098.2 Protein CBG17492 [Caenorhabditis briggsae]
MRVLLIFLLIGLAAAVPGKRSKSRRDTTTLASLHSRKLYLNPLYAEFDEPSKTTIDNLYRLKGLRVLEFYQALNELYLTGGFEKSGTINKIILSQPEIPNDTFHLLIRTLRRTRDELKEGDASLEELNTQLEGTTDSELTQKLLKAVKLAVRNATQTTDAEETSWLQKISKIDLNSVEDLKALNEGNGEDAKLLADLLEQLKAKLDSGDFKKISSATQNAFYTGVGGVDDVRATVVGGARLIYNMGLDNGKEQCVKLKNAVSTDIKFYKRLDWAMEIVKKLNRSDEETGRPGYSYIFESFFDDVAPEGQLIFSPSKMLKIRTMLPFLKDLESVEDLELLMKMLRSVTRDKYRIREHKKLFDSLQDDDKVLEILNEKFELNLEDNVTAILYRNILETIAGISVDSAYFHRYVKSVKSIMDTQDPKKILNNIISGSELSRDSKWRDIFQSISAAFEIDKQAQPEVIAPFKELNSTVSGSYQEVFLAMKMLLEGSESSEQIEAKCQFTDQFFTGLKQRDTVIDAIGIQVDKIHDWTDSTKYIDALVEVLKAADSFKNLNRLLDFHAKYTTVDQKPMESMDLIDNFIIYLEQSSRWNRKNFLHINFEEFNMWEEEE